MNDDRSKSTAQMLLDQFDSHTCTVWFIPQPRGAVDAQWSDSEVFASLRSAIKGVERDAGKSIGYDVIIHEDGSDRHLTADELHSLLAAVRAEDDKAKKVAP